MDLERSEIKKEEKNFSLHQLNPSFYNKIMSRYSLGYSKRISYHRSPVKVPLEWEVQPGKPKIGKAPLLIKRPPPDMATATTATNANAGFCKKVEKKKVDLITLIREAKLLETDNSIDASGSEDYGGNSDLFNSDCDETNPSISTSSSSSSLSRRSSSSATLSPKWRLQMVSRGLVKWAFGKPRRGNK